MAGSGGFLSLGQPLHNGAVERRLAWGDELLNRAEWAALATTLYFLDANGFAIPVTAANGLPTTGGGGGGGGLTNTELRASAVTVDDPDLPDLTGTWGYRAGVSGSPTSFTGRVVGIAAHATTAGSMTINGGDSVPIPANVQVMWTPTAQLVSPTLVFTGTDSYLVEYLS